jgi:hypothetical protein
LSPALPIGYAAIRTAAAIILSRRAHAQGVGVPYLLAQGRSDASLGLGIIAFGDPRLAEHLGGALTLLVTYAAVWEMYVGAMRVGEQLEDTPGADLSAASIGRPIFGVWEALAVVPAIVMASIGANARPGGGAYLFESDALDALIAAVVGVVVLIWVHRRPPSSQGLSLLVRGLGILLLLTAVWVWL